MPTRFVVNDFADLKDTTEENLKTREARDALRKKVRDSFTNVYRNMPNPKENEKAGHTKFLFTRLRFWEWSKYLFKSRTLKRNNTTAWDSLPY